MRELETLKPWRTYLAAALDWFCILCCFYAVHRYGYGMAPIAMLIIASRQHALLVLMHEQVHFRLGKSRFWTEVFSDVFLAFPILVSTRLYRRTHFLHHSSLNTQQDPDLAFMKAHDEWRIPTSAKDLRNLILKDISMLHFRENLIRGPFVVLWSPLVRLFRPEKSPQGGLSFRYKVFVLCFYVATVFLIFRFGLGIPILLLWIVPMGSLLPALVRMRAFPEHLGLELNDAELGSRTVMPISGLEAFLIAPHNIHIHREHHENPRIPFYNLPKFSEIMRAEMKTQNVFSSYFGSKGALAHLIGSKSSRLSLVSDVVSLKAPEENVAPGAEAKTSSRGGRRDHR